MKIKKTFPTLLISTILYILQTYWATGEYFDNLSSGCLDCSIWPELIFNSVLQCIILILLFLIFQKFKSRKTWQILSSSTLLIAFWIFTNNEIFKERVSGWSTFLTSEEWMATISDSFFPISVCIVVYIFLLNLILSKKSEKQENKL